jgi:hypothetical protein
MDPFTADDLRALGDHRHRPCVSFLMHTTPGGRHEDCLRWKGLLEQADRLLRAGGESGINVKTLLGPARDLLDDSQFWMEVSESLAVFVAPGIFRTFRVALISEDCVVVGDEFHADPMAALLDDI